MTRAANRPTRRGFTLVELMVVMAVIIILASISLLVVPGIIDQDRTTDGASLTRQWLMIAKNRAARDQLPRGVRLLIQPEANNRYKNPAAGGSALLVTELQYIEAPPAMIPNPDPNINVTVPPFGGVNNNPPQVRFYYNLDGQGQVTGRQCRILNLNADQAPQVSAGAVLSLPLLGTYHTILNNPAPSANMLVTLDYYPDTSLGAAGLVPPKGPPRPTYVTYHFGIYGTPQPLIGEPTLQLPKNTCIDLNTNFNGHYVSYPPPSANEANVLGHYDIVFSPSGQVLPFGSAGTAGQIYLWVRDYTKTASVLPQATAPNWRFAANSPEFQTGGSHQLVTLKTKSGALGVFPVLWPDNLAAGTYNPGRGPYTLATLGATAP